MTHTKREQLEQEADDLIMRLKDCISHEDNHEFGPRCITRVQFKQQMKALYSDTLTLEEAIAALPPVMQATVNGSHVQAFDEGFNTAIDQATTNLKRKVEGK